MLAFPAISLPSRDAVEPSRPDAPQERSTPRSERHKGPSKFDQELGSVEKDTAPERPAHPKEHSTKKPSEPPEAVAQPVVQTPAAQVPQRPRGQAGQQAQAAAAPGSGPQVVPQQPAQAAAIPKPGPGVVPQQPLLEDSIESASVLSGAAAKTAETAPPADRLQLLARASDTPAKPPSPETRSASGRQATEPLPEMLKTRADSSASQTPSAAPDSSPPPEAASAPATPAPVLSASAVSVPAPPFPSAPAPAAPTPDEQTHFVGAPRLPTPDSPIQAHAAHPFGAEASLGASESIAAGAPAPHLTSTRLIRTGDDSIRVLLHPRDLGELDLSIQVRKGRVMAVVHASTDQARALLTQRPAELQAALEHHGLRLDGFEFQAPTSGGDAGPEDQAGRHHDAQPSDPAAPQPASSRHPRAPSRQDPSTGRGRLDMTA
jgi:flagellar hook-length control protein FliK